MSVEAVLVKNEEPGFVEDQRPPKRGRFSAWRRGLSGLWQRDAPAIVWGVVLLLLILVSAIGPFFLQSPDAIEPANRLTLLFSRFSRRARSCCASGGSVSSSCSANAWDNEIAWPPSTRSGCSRPELRTRSISR